MSKSYSYTLVVDGDDSVGYTARISEDLDGPLRGWGESPLQAVRAMCETLREWPISGAGRWLDTTDGVKLARKFVPGFDPGNQGSPCQ